MHGEKVEECVKRHTGDTRNTESAEVRRRYGRDGRPATDFATHKRENKSSLFEHMVGRRESNESENWPL